MSKVAVVFWSGTGNTEVMANEIAKGVNESGSTADVIPVSNFSENQIDNYDLVVFGCSAMGSECLEESEFEPLFDDCKTALKDKNTALFGSYDWGDGEWMRNWENSCKLAGINLLCNSLIINNTPDDAGCAECFEFGKNLV